MDHLHTSRDLSSASANEPQTEERFGRLKTCFLALALVIAPPIVLAAYALDDFVFPYVEAQPVEPACLSSEMIDAGPDAQSFQVPAAEAPGTRE